MGSTVLVDFPIQQYSEIPVEIQLAWSPLKGKKCTVKLDTAIIGQPSSIPPLSYKVEFQKGAVKLPFLY